MGIHGEEQSNGASEPKRVTLHEGIDLRGKSFDGRTQGQNIDQELPVSEEATEAMEKKVKKMSSQTPSKMYKALFGPMNPDSTAQFNAWAHMPTQFAPQSVIGLLHKKIKGARTRISNRKEEVNEIRRALRAGVIEKRGCLVRLTPDERKAVQQKKLQLQAELVGAKSELKIYRTQLEEATQKNSLPLVHGIQNVREAAFAQRMAPSISKRILHALDQDEAMKANFLEKVKDEAPGEPAERFLEFLKGGSILGFELLEKKPKLATKVRQKVMEEVAA